MKGFKKIALKLISSAVILILTFKTLPAFAEGQNQFTFDKENATLTVFSIAPNAADGANPFPWFTFADDIKKVIIKSEVNKITFRSFFEFKKLESLEIEEGVEIIGLHAFDGCSSLKEIVIPSSVSELQSSAFENCTNLEKITLPDTDIRIGSEAFRGTKYHNDTSNWENNGLYIDMHLIAYERNASKVIIKPNTRTIAELCFVSNLKLFEAAIPEGVRVLGAGAFSGCNMLKSVTLPGTLKRIEYSAFYACNHLKEITIPKGVEYIGTNAFGLCEGLVLKVKFGTYSYSYAQMSNMRYELDCKHENREERGVVKVTCTTDGYTGDIYCPECGIISTGSVISAIHTFDAQGMTVKEPTCFEVGVREGQCLVCKEHVREEFGILSHSFDAGKVTKFASETEYGIREYTCIHCGLKKQIQIDKIVTYNSYPSYTGTDNSSELDISNVDFILNPLNEEHSAYKNAEIMLQDKAESFLLFEVITKINGKIVNVDINEEVKLSIDIPESLGKDIKIYHFSKSSGIQEVRTELNKDKTKLRIFITQAGNYALCTDSVIAEDDVKKIFKIKDNKTTKDKDESFLEKNKTFLIVLVSMITVSVTLATVFFIIQNRKRKKLSLQETEQ